MLCRFIDAVADWALGPLTTRPPPPSQPRMTAADLTTPRPAERDGPLPTGSADGTMRVGTCPLACRTRWSVWVVDGENRRLWSTYVDHRSEAAARAAGERALVDLRRGVRPTEP
jgi:hypothetical protein